MTRTPLAIFLALFAAACAGDKDDSLLHATCDNLDERGLDDRLDDLVTNNTEVLDLDGHCLEATFNQISDAAWSTRFAPQTDEGETPNYHIQIFFLPPEESMQLEAFTPNDLMTAQCVSVPEGSFCGHVDNNASDPGVDDVDYRILGGYIDMTVTDETEAWTRFEGPFEWALGTIDVAQQPFAPNSPSVRLEGTLKLTVDK